MTTPPPSADAQYPGDAAEPDAHVFMRRAKSVLKGLLIADAVATAATVLFFPSLAHLPAIPLPILVIVYVLVQYRERDARASVLRSPGATGLGKRELEADVENAGIYTGLGVAVLLVLGTFAIAAIFFDWTFIAVGATAMLVLALLINLPYLTLFVTEAEREELEKLRRERQARGGEPSDEADIT